MKSLLAGLVVLFAAGCSSQDTSSTSEALSKAKKNPGLASDITGAPACPYKGGCDGDIHPTSANVSVDGNDCGVNGKAATMHMDPDGPNGDNPGWILDSDGGTCGALSIAGSHLDKFPQKGETAWGDKDRVMLGSDAASDAILSSGPIDHVPHAINGSGTAGGHAVKFAFYFGDE